MSAYDLYAVLEVEPSATQADIDRAFRLLARRYHPDTRPDAKGAEGNHLQLVLKAYAVLRDPKRRAAYDRRRRTAAAEAGVPVEVEHRRPAPPQEPDLRVGPVRWHGPA